MNIGEWPDWATPRAVHDLIESWLGPERTDMVEVALVVLFLLFLLVKFVLEPLGIRRK